MGNISVTFKFRFGEKRESRDHFLNSILDKLEGELYRVSRKGVEDEQEEVFLWVEDATDLDNVREVFVNSMQDNRIEDFLID